MEAVPRLSMLHFDLKYSPENTDFLLKLKRLIHVSLAISLSPLYHLKIKSLVFCILQPFFLPSALFKASMELFETENDVNVEAFGRT